MLRFARNLGRYAKTREALRSENAFDTCRMVHSEQASALIFNAMMNLSGVKVDKIRAVLVDESENVTTDA